MSCSNPFPLSSSDAQSFQNDLGQYFADLPPWGGMFAWKGRLILAAFKADQSMVFSDISGGIPWSQAAGGCIPAQAFLKTFSSGEYISPTEAFFMSLPQNFIQVAKERMDQLISAGEWAIDETGNLVNKITGGIIEPIVKPATELLWPLAIVAGVIFFMMYMPKRKES
jgi:hypothetical protein